MPASSTPAARATASSENVNDGHRTGGRLALHFETGGLSITPRMLYQEISAGGFNRQEVYNLYANPFTTAAGGRPPIQLGERQQHLLLDEAFEDRTYLADLNVSYDFGPVELTSVSSYIHRDILVSRDASALTGSVSVDLGFLPAGVLLPSNLVDTTDLDSLHPGASALLDRVRAVPVGRRRLRIRRSTASTASGCPPRATTPSPTPGSAPAPRRRRPRRASRPIRPTPRTCPTTSARRRSSARAATTSRRRSPSPPAGAITGSRRSAGFISSGLFSNGDNKTDDATESDGFSPRVIASYEVADNIRVNAQASKGFRLGGVNDPLNIPLCTGGATGVDALTYGNHPTYEDETLWNYELGVRGQRSGLNFAAAAFYTDINNLQVTADAGTCSSRVVFNVPSAHTMGVEFELSAEPVEGLDLSINGIDPRVRVRFRRDRPRPARSSPASARATGCRRVPNFQISAAASYTFPIADGADAYVGASFQHVGSRYTQPSDQESNPRTFVHNLPFGGAPAGAATTVDLRLPAYDYVNLSAGIDWDNGLGVMVYVNNLFDENALLSFDRERGGRARLGFNIGQPRDHRRRRVRRRF